MKLFSIIRRKLQRRAAPTIREEDVWLASYPRSGNTWVRFLIANLRQYPHGPPVDFHSVHKVIGDLEQPSQWPGIEALEPPRVLKSHAIRDHRFRRAIYIVRDGRDVLCSYYHYLKGKGEFSGTLGDFINHEPWPCHWEEHVLAWSKRFANPEVLWVRYEDLVANPLHHLARIARYLSLPAEPERLQWSVEHSNADTMKRLEASGGRAFDNDSGLVFVRTAKVGDWKNHMNEELHELFWSRAGEAMRVVGYQSSGWRATARTDDE